MEYYKHPPEYAPLPEEQPSRPELELAAPPPEFGQGTTAPVGEKKPKRRLRQFLAVPAAVLLSFFCLHGVKLPTPAGPSESSEPAAVQTADPLPDRPQGSVVLDVLYAVLDEDTVRYSYSVYTPIPSLDADQEQIDAYQGTPWPISVYARLSDEGGTVVAPEYDPDVWENSRAFLAYSMGTGGLQGDLTLTLTAVYTEEGEERQTQVVLPLEALPPTPQTHAELTLLGGGSVDYRAAFIPQPGDEHPYRLQATRFTFVWMDASGEVVDELMAYDWDTLPSLNGNSGEGGFAAAYEGPAALERPSEDAVQLCARLVITDLTTGYPYTIDSNVVVLPPEPFLEGRLEAFPGGDVEATFRFVPAPNDPQEYELHVIRMGQTAYQGDDMMGFSLVDDPSAVPVTGDRSSGYEVHYSGGSAAASIPEDAQLSLYVVLEDARTGDQYTIETNRVDPVERIVPYETYPLGDGKITFTVYNDTPDYFVPTTVETGTGLTILALDTYPEAEFESYDLPSAFTPEGYEFAGWVVHVNNPMDISAGGDIFGEYGGDPPPEALTGTDSFAFRVYGQLTKDDVLRVPPSDDGVRYVNVHAVWIKQDPEEELLFLDDGNGGWNAYGMDTPLYSEGYIYLCNYPTPSRVGMEFDGWYDAEGNRVELLVSYFSFAPVMRNADGSFAGYDWSGDYVPIYLTAHWKSSGGH